MVTDIQKVGRSILFIVENRTCSLLEDKIRRFYRHTKSTNFIDRLHLSRHRERGCVLGVNGGLYYVRNGSVNDYALTFNLPLRPDITDIYFNWNASADQSPVRTHDTDMIKQVCKFILRAHPEKLALSLA